MTEKRDYSIVYADDISDWPLGYLEFYTERYNQFAQTYYNKYPKRKDDLQKVLYNQRWHFCRSVQKTHSYSIPKFVLVMKLKKFIKEQVEKVVNKNKPKQLEFKFD